MVLSEAQVRTLPSLFQARPLTTLSWALVCHISSLAGRSHTFTTPSPEALANLSREDGSFAIIYTPSTCPLPNEDRKGFANMRSTLVALRARVYSLALSKGCSAGS